MNPATNLPWHPKQDCDVKVMVLIDSNMQMLNVHGDKKGIQFEVGDYNEISSWMIKRFLAHKYCGALVKGRRYYATLDELDGVGLSLDKTIGWGMV